MKKKAGMVALVGRPNAGKSTLLNALIGRKVSITSPKPQTTRFSIQAVYEDERGQILFFDTPGIFGKVEDTLAANINLTAEETIRGSIDALVYVIDHTRERSTEENKIIGIVRKVKKPKILVINKSDVKHPSFIEQYTFLDDEFDTIIRISAATHHNLNILIDNIFDIIPEGDPLVDTKGMIQPAINLDSKTYISEIIREKVYLQTRAEIPYTITVVVDEIQERDNGIIYVKARILTTSDRYKVMLIGKGGRKVKEIGMYARKELQVATDKKVFVDLTVETDPHWVERML